MNPELPIDPRQALEASLTALVVGELPPDQARFLRQTIASDPELAKTFERLKQTIELVRKTESGPGIEPVSQPVAPTLSNERRQALLQRFKTVQPPEFKQAAGLKTQWLVPAAAAAVLLLLVGASAFSYLSRPKARYQRQFASDKSESLAMLKNITPLPGSSSAGRLAEHRLVDGDKNRLVNEAPPALNQIVPLVVLSPPGPDSAGNTARNLIVLPVENKPESPAIATSAPTPAGGELSFSADSQQLPAGSLSASSFSAGRSDNSFMFGGGAGLGGVVAGNVQDRVLTLGDTPLLGGAYRSVYATRLTGGVVLATSDSLSLKDNESAFSRDGKTTAIGNAPQTALPALELRAGRAPKTEADQKLALAGLERSQEDLTKSLPNNQAGEINLREEQKKGPVELLARRKSNSEKEITAEPADVTPPKPALQAPAPQPEIQTRDNAFSTFSLNVSDVSFKLAAASLERGSMPEPAGIRSEEFINEFDYRDPDPAAGLEVAFAWERASYPFAQNRDALRFSIKTAASGRLAGQALNVVLLLDNSGSMERSDRVAILREALRVLATQLQAQDTLSVVTFARTARLWVDGVPGNQAGQVADELSRLTPQGGTNLEEAMNLAYQTALRHYATNGINRVVLLTDGAANLGNTEPEALKAKVVTHRKQGIALDCFGIGWEGYNDDLLEILTRNGNGRYGFLNTPEEAATGFAGQLAGALHVAASNVKVQVEFNPNRVASYRQVGYARHQLAKEEFRDNSVAAAQLGAAESGNALYVIEANPQGQGPLAVVRVRYQLPGTAEYREHEWTVPFTGNATPLGQASSAMRLAVTAGAFSEWLATSPYAAEVTPRQLLGYLAGVPAVYGADPRPLKLEWMIRQAQTLSGK